MSSPSAKATLLGLGILFLFPLVMAWLMYSGIIDYRPGKTSNRGTLVQPPVQARWPEPFEQLGLEGAWILIYTLPEECNEACLEDRTGLRQVRRALGRGADRVQTVYVTQVNLSHPSVKENSGLDPGALVVQDSSGILSGQLAEIGGSGIFLIDPLGNIIMHYPRGSNPDDIRKDLERLLKYGKTDPQ